MNETMKDIISMPNLDDIYNNLVFYIGDNNDIFIEEFIYDHMSELYEDENINEFVVDRLMNNIDEQLANFDEYLASMGANEADYDKYHMIYIHALAKEIIRNYKQRNAINNAENYQNDSDMVDYYGSEGRTWNKGYDHYMEGNITSDEDLLYKITEAYTKQKNDAR